MDTVNKEWNIKVVFITFYKFSVTETDKLRKKSEDDQRMIERLQKERDEAQTEAQSFTRSFLGFYRKNKQSQ